MTREEAIAIIRKEYLCVDRDCNIERSCGKCDLMMPSKEPILEAYKMAIKALEQEPCEDCVSRQAVLDEIRAEIENDWLLKKYPSSPFSCGLRRAIEIIDKYKADSEEG